jgi:phosphatidylserine/phosphatidylglycerophosphate/cardiolipin synthase-like enzyme
LKIRHETPATPKGPVEKPRRNVAAARSNPASDLFSRSAPRAALALDTTVAAAGARRLLPAADYLPVLKQLIAGAKSSIDIVQYNFYSESGQVKELTQQLIDEKRQNPSLNIRVFVEADHGDAAPRNVATLRALEAAGITVVRDSPERVTHAKAVVVDGRYVVAGSHNLSNTSLTKNNEVSLLLDSPVLAKAVSGYIDDLVEDSSRTRRTSATDGPVKLVTDTGYFRELIEMVRGAKTTLDVSMYYVGVGAKDHDKVSELMTELKKARARGVKVRVYLEQSDAFAPVITSNNLVAAEKLKAMGAEVHFDPPGKISHSKFVVTDRKQILMGSTNWSDDDFSRRHQLNWRIEDPRMARQLSALLTDKILHESADPIADPLHP